MQVAAITVCLILAFLTINVQPQTANQKIVFAGHVKRSQKFVRLVAKNLIFELVPTEYGWEIVVHSPDRSTENLARLTPPFHFVPNPCDIDGWHFRNADNTGPNEGSVNAPQAERAFIFSSKVGDTIDYPLQFNEVESIRSDGQGLLTITSLKLGNLEKGQKANIKSMKFMVVLTISF